MKHMYIATRFIAILLLIIPGVIATIGFLFMKNVIFDYIVGYGDDNLATPKFQWSPFIFGLLLFIMGIGFVSGWIRFRDRKRNYALRLQHLQQHQRMCNSQPSSHHGNGDCL